MSEDGLTRFWEFWNLRGDDKHSPDYGYEGHNQKRLGKQAMFSKRNLHRIEQLDHQKNQQYLVQ